MAMTKKELAEVTSRIMKAETKAALRWTTPVPRDLPAPEACSGGHIEGWDYNTHSQQVFKAWSESTACGNGEYPTPEKRRSGWASASRGSLSLFSTEELAYKAMRHEMEQQFAKKLYEVDQWIAAKGGNLE